MVLSGTWTDRACLTARNMDSFFLAFALARGCSHLDVLRHQTALQRLARLSVRIAGNHGKTAWLRADYMIYAAKVAR